MKNKIYLILILIVVCKVVHAQNESIIFMGKQITFGLSSAEFLNDNVGYNLNTDGNKYGEIKVYYKSISEEIESNSWFIIYVKFYNNKLFEMQIDERWAVMEDVKSIQELIKQFKVIKEETNNDEGGWYKQYLEKGKLRALYGGAGEGSFFTCNEIELLKEVQKKYPDYGK